MAFEIESGIPLEQQDALEYLTSFACRHNGHRRGATVAVTRKFLAECGTKIIVDIGVRGEIVKMAPEYPCDAGKDCPRCKDRMSKIAILIESGK
jgi:hypothetical protein